MTPRKTEMAEKKNKGNRTGSAEADAGAGQVPPGPRERASQEVRQLITLRRS